MNGSWSIPILGVSVLAMLIAVIPLTRVPQGRCWMCRKPLPEGERECSDCYDRRQF
jgi:hypothetical protein